MRPHAAIVAALFSLLCSPAGAEMNGTLRIGVMNDMSSVYSDFQGPGSVVAAQLAAEDFAKQSKRKVEILSADHQNKADVGASIARRWFDVDGVDMIIDLPTSAVALAVADIAARRTEVLIGSGAGSSLLTGAKCSPNTVHWTYDTWAMGARRRARRARARRQELVLGHRRLCVRSGSGKAGQRRSEGGRRPGAWQRPPPARCQRLLILPAPGASLRRPGDRARQCRRRHRQHDQAGRRFISRREARRSSR